MQIRPYAILMRETGPRIPPSSEGDRVRLSEGVSKCYFSRPSDENQRSTCEAEVKSYKSDQISHSNTLIYRLLDFE